MVIATVLVVAVVFIFLRSPKATLIPAVAVTTSLIGTFAGMYLLGYSVNNLSLMALTVSTGFVVDDAIVVMENITRLIEQGMSPMEGIDQGRARGELHRAFHEPFADRRLRSAAVDGRAYRAAVSRICDDAVPFHRGLDGDLAHRHAHDVRVPAEARRPGKNTAISTT